MAIMDWIGKNIKFITEKELTNMPKKRFNIDEYPGKYVMYCENQEELFKFYDYLHSVGRRWSMGQSYLDFRPTVSFAGPTRDIYFNDGTHGDTHCNWYELLKFKDFDWSDSTMKFKVGDKVRVKNDLIRWHTYGGYTYTGGMEEMIGDKVATISHVDHGRREHYHLAGDSMYYCWTDEMLELAEEKQFTKADLKPGMVVENCDGTRYLFVNDKFANVNEWSDSKRYNDDLTHSVYDNLHIVKVYISTGYTLDTMLSNRSLTLIWERKEPVKEMTVAEIEKQLGHKVKIVDGDSK